MAAEVESRPEFRRAIAGWYLLWGYRSLLNIFMTAGLALLFVLLILRGGADDLEANLRQSRADVMALIPAAVPDADNATLDYQAAFALRVKFTGQYNDSPEYFASRSDSAFFNQASVQSYLQQNASAIFGFFKAAQKQQCEWKLNYALGYAIPLPNLSTMRDAARLMSAYARDNAHRGNHREAARTLHAMYSMARHVETDPILISGLVAISICSIADGTLEAIVLWETPTNADDIAAYRKALWIERNWRERAVRMMVSEKRFMLYTLDDLVNASQRTGMPPMAAAFGMPTNMSSPILWYGNDRRCCKTVMDEIIDDIRNGKLSTDVDMETRIARNQTGPAFLALSMLPTLSRAETAFARSNDQGLLADTALAWLQFRARYKQDAESLDKLVPEFLSAVPRDSFRGNSFVMRRDPSGIHEKPVPNFGSPKKPKQPAANPVLHPGVIRIYTFGQDGKDDDGLSTWLEEVFVRSGHNEYDDDSFRIPPLKAIDAPEAKK